MVHLAGLPPGTWAGIAELSQAAEVSPAFLIKVLKTLTVSGLMVSRRGPGGGFALAAPASQISLLDVVEAIEGPLQLNVCTGVCAIPVTECHRQTWCAVHSVWMHAQAGLRAVLVQASLESLARESARNIETIRRLQYVGS